MSTLSDVMAAVLESGLSRLIRELDGTAAAEDLGVTSAALRRSNRLFGKEIQCKR